MKLYDRIIAGVVWLQKFTPFSPNNLEEQATFEKNLVQWGNFSIGYNMYPNLFNIFVKYAPTATSLIRKKVNLIVGNVPQEIKVQRTTFESSYTNTVENLLQNICRDYVMFDKSFALWVGYDENGKVNEFKRLSLDNVRYVIRDEETYTQTRDRYMIALMNEENRIGQIYNPYDPTRVLDQIKEETERTGEEFPGQILFYNSADDQDYPDCIFNAMVPILLADGGSDTMIMSYLGNADICKTYKKKQGATGTDTANSLLGWTNLNRIWGREGDGRGIDSIASTGSDFYNTGVKAAGETEYLNIGTDEPIENYVKVADMPKFIDEINKIDDRTARKICVALQLPYEYIYKMESGVINQENRATMMAEINANLEDDRRTIERVINKILENSIFDWRLTILAAGEGKEDVKEATENLTE